MKNKKGYTLIELMVTFVLIGIFLASAATVMSSFMRIFLEVKTASNSRTAADTLLEVINGEISNAQKRQIETSGPCILIEKDSAAGMDTLIYFTQKGVKARMGVMGNVAVTEETQAMVDDGRLSDGLLNINYEYSQSENPSDPGKRTDWYLGKTVYMGMVITRLEFSRLTDTGNTLKAELTLQSPKTGYEFSTYKIIECYNLDGGEIRVQ